MMSGRILCAAALAALLGQAGRARAEQIDTTGAWNGSSNVFELGEPNTATYGQTFTVKGPDTVLDSFSFYLKSFSGGPVNFGAYVMEWDGAKATGPVLYQSTKQTLPAGSGFTQFTFDPGVPLTAGKQYVAFLSSSYYFTGSTSLAAIGTVDTNPYPDGRFLFRNNGPNPSLLTTTPWETWWPASTDTAFRASFSRPQTFTSPTGNPTAVPEPGALALVTLGALGLLGHSWRRARKGERGAGAGR
jgi:hypothetical protein